MITLTISELTLNAVRAALDERVARLNAEIRYYEVVVLTNGSEDAQRALVWNIAGLHETEIAREDFAEVRCVDHPVNATWSAWTEGELVAGFGK